jgi:hypothetical protein
MISKEEIVRKYLGRVYPGHHSCFQLIQEFYREEMGIDLVNDYLKLLEEFEPVVVPILGDLVTIEHPLKNHLFTSDLMIVDHLGIALGDNEFMHAGLFDSKETIVSRTHVLPYKNRIKQYLRHHDQD